MLAILLWRRQGLVWRLRDVLRVRQRVIVEDALKHVFNGQQRENLATIDSLAGALDIRVTRVVRLLRRMEDESLVESKGAGLCLTTRGKRWAMQVVRAHRLWERYLADEVGTPLMELHAQADRLEHTISPEEADRLDARMGYPNRDPHGDPIPTTDGKIAHERRFPLTDWPKDKSVRITHIEDEPKEVFAQIVASGLRSGMDLHIIEKDEHRIIIWDGETEHVLAPLVAASIHVVEAPVEPAPVERLSSLKLGEKATVLDLKFRGLSRRRFLDMGLTPGVAIEAVMMSMLKEPVAYRVRGALIALRREQSQQILIRRGAKP